MGEYVPVTEHGTEVGRLTYNHGYDDEPSTNLYDMILAYVVTPIEGAKAGLKCDISGCSPEM